MRNDSTVLPDASAVSRRCRAVKDFIYGLTAYSFVHHTQEMKHEAEALFVIATLGDLAGLPIMPPIYALRLLPHVAADIARWKRQLACRGEFWEKEEFDLHGV
jgi:hypothetical protein